MFGRRTVGLIQPQPKTYNSSIISKNMKDETDIFKNVLENVISDFQKNPFNYTKEEPVIDEIYYEFRQRLDDTHNNVEFKTGYGNKDKWTVLEATERVKKEKEGKSIGKVCRVRREIKFVKEDEARDGTFDLALFRNNSELIMHSKRDGPGDYWDTENDLSVLCEVKHSRNMGSRFYSDSSVDDIVGLSKNPAEIDERIFLFFDWWPYNKNKNKQYDERRKKLENKLRDKKDKFQKNVEVIYVPRFGDRKTTNYPSDL